MNYWRLAVVGDNPSYSCFVEVDKYGNLVIDEQDELVNTTDSITDEIEHNQAKPDEIELPYNSEDYEDKAVIHVDGSAVESNPGPGGAGITCETLDSKFYASVPLGDEVTNQQTEVYAVLNAAKLFKHFVEDPEDKEVLIHSDSLYAVNCISGDWDASSNLSAIEKSKKELEDLDVKLSWVEGHAGEYLNEVADRLAKRAAEDQEEVVIHESDQIKL